MVRRLPNWRVIATTMLFGASGTLALEAQEQPAAASKFKILVPSLEQKGTGKDIGKDVAEEMRKLIVRMPRHEPIQRKDMQEAFRKYQLKEDEMDCIRNMQLGVMMNAELVMCGQFATAGAGFQLDSVKFISTKTQEAFQVQPVQAANAKEAATQVFAQLERYLNTIERLAYCYQYIESASYQQAIENCDAALAVNPSSARANMGKAFAIYQTAGTAEQTDSAKLRESLSLYRKVLELNPVEQEALRTAGIVAARLGMQDESRNYFKQYLELNPGDAGVRVTIAGEQARAGDPEGALRVIEEGLKADSANIDLLTWGGVFAAQAAFKATDAARKAGNADMPANAKTLYQTAVTYYKRLFDLRNGDIEPSVANQMIQTLVILERAPEAVEIGRRAVAGKANTALVWAAYAGALANANQTQQALVAFDSAIAKNDTSVTGLHGRKASVQLAAGDLEGAKQSLRAAITAKQTTPDEAAEALTQAALAGFPKKDYDSVLSALPLAAEFAESPMAKSKISFWSGMAHYSKAAALGTPTKASEARNLLPMYQRALNALEDGATFGRSDARYNYAQTLEGVRKYITYLQEVIKRG